MYARITIIIISTRLPSNGEQAGNTYSIPFESRNEKAKAPGDEKHEVTTNVAIASLLQCYPKSVLQ